MLHTRPEVQDETQDVSSDAGGPLREPLASLTVELQRISEEIQSINSGFQAQVVQALAEAQRAMERDFQARLKAELDAARKELVSNLEQVQAEIKRVTELLSGVSQEIATMLDDPNAQLSIIMRKKAEESVLRAYLEGLQFSAGQTRTIR